MKARVCHYRNWRAYGLVRWFMTGSRADLCDYEYDHLLEGSGYGV